MTLGRRGAGPIVVALALVAGVVGFSGSATATTAYRYWTYYVAAPNTAAWAYSQRGPASEHPQDGEVQGWRFAIQADRAGGLTPRFSPDFAKLCGSQPVTSDKVRVGVVLDFGVADDAPASERPPASVVTGCVEVADGANGVDVLDAAVGAANVRIGQGLICGIDGYPKTECAVSVTAPAKPTTTPATALAKPPTPTGKAPAAPTTTPSAPATAPTPTTAGSQPAGTTAPGPTAPSSGASRPTASTASSTTPLAALKKPKQKVFPTGAVIGVALVFALAIAAVVRGSGSRR